jgi:transposase
MDKKLLESLIADGLTATEIASHFGKSKTTLKYWLKKYDLKGPKYAPSEYMYRVKPRKCEKCKLEVEMNQAIWNNHKRWCGHKPKPAYEMAVCSVCSKGYKRSKRSRVNICSQKCSSSRKSIKDKISKGRIKYLKENPDKHPWKDNNKFVSVPCEKLKERFRKEGLIFEAEWMPIPDQRSFSIDIAFPEIKLGIEVNGNQHYNRDGTLKDYYAERHRLIEAAGWNLLEVHFSHCYSEEKVIELIQALRENKAHEIKYTVTPRLKSKSEIYREGVRKRKQERKEKKLKLIEERKKSLERHDLTKFGWVHQVSLEWGVSHTEVRRWVKNNFPDLETYKRKSIGV